MMTVIASNLTRNTLAADRTVSTNSVIVFGWTVTSSSSTQRTITLEDTAGNVYQDIVVAPGNTAGVFIESTNEWLAAAGLVVNIDTPDSGVKFTIFHSNTQGAS